MGVNKEEIKIAKTTNRRMKKVSNKTRKMFGVNSFDLDEGVFYIGNYTYIKHYRIDKRDLTNKDKQKIIELLLNKWGKHSRVSFINVSKDNNRMQIYILTIYVRAVDYYNAELDFEQFENTVKADPDIMIIANPLKTTFFIINNLLGTDTNDIDIANLNKLDWYRMLFKDKEDDLRSITINAYKGFDSLKDLARNNFDRFIIATDIFPVTDERQQLYNKYLKMRYNKDSEVSVNYLALQCRISTDSKEESVVTFNKEACDNDFGIFISRDKERCLSDYTLGMRDYHNMRMTDVKQLIGLL